MANRELPAGRGGGSFFWADVLYRLKESVVNPPRITVTDNPNQTFPGMVALSLGREGKAYQRTFYMTKEDALELGKYLQRVLED